MDGRSCYSSGLIAVREGAHRDGLGDLVAIWEGAHRDGGGGEGEGTKSEDGGLDNTIQHVSGSRGNE